MQFGPTNRMPVPRVSTSAACFSAPSAPASAKPVEMITQPPRRPPPPPAHALDERVGSHRQDRDVRRRRGLGDRGERTAPEDLTAPRVDRIDLAREAVADQEVHDAPAELVPAVGGAEDRDGARVQEALEVHARLGARAAKIRGVQSKSWLGPRGMLAKLKK